MTQDTPSAAKIWALARWLFAAAFIVAVAWSGRLSGLMNRLGLFYIVLGSVAAALMGFTGREIATAFRHAIGAGGTAADLAKSAHFWEAAARNAWLLGALGSALNFMIIIGTISEQIAGVTARMTRAYLVTLYGLVMAVVCLIPAIKIAGRAERTVHHKESQGISGPTPSSSVTVKAWPLDRVLGYILFAATLALNVFFLVGRLAISGPLPVLLHWPSVLVVIGGSVALALFIGAGAGARAWTFGFSMTGLIGLLMGLIQGLFGFVNRNIGEIAAACIFIISACSFSLLGLITVANPLEDREIMDGRRAGPAPLSRLFWAVFPLIVFIFLLLTFIMVVTPIVKPAE